MTRFTNEQKLEAITRYQNGSESVNKIAKSIATFDSVIRNWIKHRF